MFMGLKIKVSIGKPVVLVWAFGTSFLYLRRRFEVEWVEKMVVDFCLIDTCRIRLCVSGRLIDAMRRSMCAVRVF